MRHILTFIEHNILIVMAICAIIIVLVVGIVSREAFDKSIVCYSDNGVLLIHAEGVRVWEGDAITITWPDGRKRTFISGSCAYGPKEQPAESPQSWEGDADDSGPRWASL